MRYQSPASATQSGDQSSSQRINFTSFKEVCKNTCPGSKGVSGFKNILYMWLGLNRNEQQLDAVTQSKEPKEGVATYVLFDCGFLKIRPGDPGWKTLENKQKNS